MRRIILLMALFAFVTACDSASEDEIDITGSATEDEIDITGAIEDQIDITGNWQLRSGSVDGQAIPLIDGSPVTLNVTGTEIGGTSACNSYGGRFVLDGSSISIRDLMTTLMMCTPDVMAVEVPYSAALPEVDTVAIASGQLVMTGPGIELRFSLAG